MTYVYNKSYYKLAYGWPVDDSHILLKKDIHNPVQNQ